VALRMEDGCQTRGADVNYDFRRIDFSPPMEFSAMDFSGGLVLIGPDPSDRPQSTRSVYSVTMNRASKSILPGPSRCRIIGSSVKPRGRSMRRITSGSFTGRGRSNWVNSTPPPFRASPNVAHPLRRCSNSIRGGPGEGFDWPLSNHGVTVDYKGNVCRDLAIGSDVICPGCFVAKTNLEKALLLAGGELGLRITWRPL
jgi:hypothetical protein